VGREGDNVPQAAGTTGKIARILVVDDHPIVREGITGLLSSEPDLKVIGEASTLAGALETAKSLNPDVAIVDISLGKESGLDLIRDLSRAHPDLAIIVLSIHSETVLAQRALRAGAHGYVMKQEGTDALLGAIRKVLGGEIHLSPELTRQLVEEIKTGPQDPDPTTRLSERELEIYRLIGEGLATREIAERLEISVKTVESHRSHIKEKIGLRSNNELVARAARWIAR
jgi:DNA-binding NarL/FixJ family response regulator